MLKQSTAQDDMLELRRRLESGRVSEKASMAQLAMLHLQDDTERTAVQVSQAVMRAQGGQALLTQG